MQKRSGGGKRKGARKEEIGKTPASQKHECCKEEDIRKKETKTQIYIYIYKLTLAEDSGALLVV